MAIWALSVVRRIWVRIPEKLFLLPLFVHTNELQKVPTWRSGGHLSSEQCEFKSLKLTVCWKKAGIGSLNNHRRDLSQCLSWIWKYIGHSFPTYRSLMHIRDNKLTLTLADEPLFTVGKTVHQLLRAPTANVELSLCQLIYKVSPFRSVRNECKVMWSLIHLFSYWFITSQSSLFIWKLKVRLL